MNTQTPWIHTTQASWQAATVQWAAAKLAGSGLRETGTTLIALALAELIALGPAFTAGASPDDHKQATTLLGTIGEVFDVLVSNKVDIYSQKQTPITIGGKEYKSQMNMINESIRWMMIHKAWNLAPISPVALEWATRIMSELSDEEIADATPDLLIHCWEFDVSAKWNHYKVQRSVIGRASPEELRRLTAAAEGRASQLAWIKFAAEVIPRDEAYTEALIYPSSVRGGKLNKKTSDVLESVGRPLTRFGMSGVGVVRTQQDIQPAVDWYIRTKAATGDKLKTLVCEADAVTSARLYGLIDSTHQKPSLVHDMLSSGHLPGGLSGLLERKADVQRQWEELAETAEQELRALNGRTLNEREAARLAPVAWVAGVLARRAIWISTSSKDVPPAGRLSSWLRCAVLSSGWSGLTIDRMRGAELTAYLLGTGAPLGERA